MEAVHGSAKEKTWALEAEVRPGGCVCVSLCVYVAEEGGRVCVCVSVCPSLGGCTGACPSA